jgi:hypothetical protein
MPQPIELLKAWLKRARENQFAHYAAARRLEKRHSRIGIPAAVLSAIVGTSVFASLEANVQPWMKIAVGLLSVTAAILTSLQTFWRFSERAERHRKAAAEYASIRREMEQYLTFADGVTLDTMGRLRKRLDDLASEFPSIDSKDWETAKRTADNAYFGSPPTSPRMADSTAQGPPSGAG